MTQRTHEVVVHKASLTLMKDESIHQFTQTLKDEAKKFLTQKFNVDTKKGRVWPIEIFATKAVFTVIPDLDKPPSNDFKVAVKFSRSADTGQFNFTDTMKVKAVTIFQPVEGLSITKAKDVPEPAPQAWEMGAWTPAEVEKTKSIFSGVL